MTNTELNKYHRGRMQGTCREAVQFDWQDGEFMDFLLGGLPVINKEGLREQVQDKQVQDKYYRLEKAYQTYSFFSTDRERFYSDIMMTFQKCAAEHLGVAIADDLLDGKAFLL